MEEPGRQEKEHVSRPNQFSVHTPFPVSSCLLSFFLGGGDFEIVIKVRRFYSKKTLAGTPEHFSEPMPPASECEVRATGSTTPSRRPIAEGFG